MLYGAVTSDARPTSAFGPDADQLAGAHRRVLRTLGDAATQAAVHRGRRMTVETMVDHALVWSTGSGPVCDGARWARPVRSPPHRGRQATWKERLARPIQKPSIG